jgi:hypothetical protein
MLFQNLFFPFLLIFFLNIPFGYWRGGTRKFSLQWYLAIHLPIPFIVFIRIFFEYGWGYETYIVFILAFFLGQLAGKYIRKYRDSRLSH